MIRSVDLFCGFGGLSRAIIDACKARRLKLDLVAVNHWKTAINSHSLNHPTVRHICEPVENLSPAQVIPGRHLHLLTAGVECTYHSNARGGGPCNEQSRSQAWQLINWVTKIHVDTLLVENVREFVKWGPLYPCTCGTKNPKKHRKGSKCLLPIPERSGEFFNSFVGALRGLGRSVDWRLQCAADFGDPTSRVRLLLISHADNRPVLWPEPTHCDPDLLPTLPPKQRRRLKPWRPAADCIDFSIEGKSVFNQDGTFRHCENTMERIRADFRKFGGLNAEPFLVLLRGTGKSHLENSAQPITHPLGTLTTTGRHHLLVEPFLLPNEGFYRGNTAKSLRRPMPTIIGKGVGHLVEPIIIQTDQTGSNGACATPVQRPLKTIVSKQNMLLVQPFMYHATHQAKHPGDHLRRCHSTRRPMPTVTGAARGELYLCEPFLAKFYGTGICKSLREPLDTITTKDRFMLVQTKHGPIRAQIDVLTRLLQPDELKLAHSFPKSYIITGTKEDQTTQVGNSVPVKLACAHVTTILSHDPPMTITFAAIRIDQKHIFRGCTHFTAFTAAMDEGLITQEEFLTERYEEGFLTSTNEFLDRETAFELAISNGQATNPAGDYLDALECDYT